MMAFSAYEFLNLVLPGALVISIGFNDFVDEIITTENQVLQLLIVSGAAFIIGHVCAGTASVIVGTEKLRYHDPTSGSINSVELTRWLHQQSGGPADAPHKLPGRTTRDARKSVERLLELLGKDSHARMLGQQENLHRNLAMASIVSMVVFVATESAGRNLLGWPVLLFMPALALFFVARYLHFRRGLAAHLETSVSLLPTAKKYADLA